MAALAFDIFSTHVALLDRMGSSSNQELELSPEGFSELLNWAESYDNTKREAREVLIHRVRSERMKEAIRLEEMGLKKLPSEIEKEVFEIVDSYGKHTTIAPLLKEEQPIFFYNAYKFKIKIK